MWLQLLDRCVRSKHRTQLDGESCGELALQQLMALQTGESKQLCRTVHFALVLTASS